MTQTTSPQVEAPASMNGPWRWFARTYGFAIVAHLAANAPSGRDPGGPWLTWVVVISAVLGLAALVLLVRPSRRLLGLTAGLALLSVWLELPYIGNHWLLVGLVSVAVLVSLLYRDPWTWFAPTARWIMLGFYCFAAFAKLNSGFMDPSVSCGVFYANQSLASFGLPTVATTSPLAALTIAGPMLTELSVPLLLAFGRTRRIGVLLALCFHTAISLDLDQHFFDFTAALVMLLCLFLPESTVSDLESRAARRTRAFSIAVTGCAVMVAASVLPDVVLTTRILQVVPFMVWVPFAVWLIARVALGGLGASHVPMRLPNLVSGVILAVVLANGMAPYLELKTAYSFNMYANLVTVGGESNHLVVRRTFPLTDVQEHLLTVVSTEDPDLHRYATEGYLIPERNLLDYLARHPTTTVVVRDGDQERTLDGSDGVRMPLLVSKLQLFRAVDSHDPPRCQAAWLPAR